MAGDFLCFSCCALLLKILGVKILAIASTINGTPSVTLEFFLALTSCNSPAQHLRVQAVSMCKCLAGMILVANSMEAFPYLRGHWIFREIPSLNEEDCIPSQV